jgi:hypothetical protein
MKPPLKLMVVSIDTTVKSWATRIHTLQKNYQACHVLWSLFQRSDAPLFFAVNAKGKNCFSVLQNNTVPPINNFFVEKECYFHNGMVHHLLFTVTQQVFSMTIFLKVGLGTGKGQAMHPNLP